MKYKSQKKAFSRGRAASGFQLISSSGFFLKIIISSQPVASDLFLAIYYRDNVMSCNIFVTVLCLKGSFLLDCVSI